MENQTQQQILELNDFQLTFSQMRYLQALLPEGIILIQEKIQKQQTSHPQKKIFKQQKEHQQSFQVNNNDQDDSRRPKRQKKQRQTYFEDFDSSPLIKNKYKQQQLSQYQENSNEDMKKCFKILTLLKKHKYAGPFLEPVDPCALNIPDYFDIIKEPMDLSTVEKNLKEGVYQNMSGFGTEIKKIWMNAMLYNPPGTDIHIMAQELSDYYEKIFRDVESDKNGHINELQRRVDRLTRELKDLHQAKGSKINSKSNSRINLDKPMSIQEKRSLGQNIRLLPPEHLRVVCEIVSEGQDIPQDEIEIDIDTLPTRKCRELERFVKSKMQSINKNKQVTQQQNKKKTSPAWNNNNKDQTDPFFNNNQPINTNGSQQQLNQFSNYQFNEHRTFLNQQQNIHPVPVSARNSALLFQENQMDYLINQPKQNNNNIDESDSSFITESDDSEDNS